ncbi:hypothetical protein [Borrelia persica]|uniref:hypothetical protein n=1 Tax=Borrelia persica TaxID=44448 RepID=UPI001F2C37B7|nr:hypothetical protein [Borrelia persica]
MRFIIVSSLSVLVVLACNHSKQDDLTKSQGYSSGSVSSVDLSRTTRSADFRRGSFGISDILLILENYKMEEKNQKLNLDRQIKNVNDLVFPFHKMPLLKDSIATRHNVIAALQHKSTFLYNLENMLKILDLDNVDSNESILANKFVLLLERLSDITIQLIYGDFHKACLDRLKRATDQELLSIIYKRLKNIMRIRKLVLDSFEFVMNVVAENMDSLKTKFVNKEYVLSTLSRLVGDENVLVNVLEGMQDRVNSLRALLKAL